MQSIINQLGFGSGVDTAALIRDLANASRAPKVALFQARAEAVQAKISVVARVRLSIDGLAQAVSQLASKGSLQPKLSVSDASVLALTAAATAGMDDSEHVLSVSQIARGQSVYSEVAAARDAPVGRGDLLITVGDRTATVAIDASNDSLDGIAQAIEAAGLGLDARVVADQGGFRLAVKGPSGGGNAFSIAPQAGSDPGLALAGYGAGGQMMLAQAAQDAIFSIDGVPYQRSGNLVSDAVDGVAITLLKAAPGTDVAISATLPPDGFKAAAAEFVTAYNAVKTEIAAARDLIGGDQSLRMIDQRLAGLISQALGTPGTGLSLGAIGIVSNRDGSALFDAARFDAAVAADAVSVRSIFAPASSRQGLANALDGLLETLNATGGVIPSLTTRLANEASKIARDRDTMEARETRYEAQLERKFAGFDARLGALRSVQSYLEQQVKLWSQSS